MTTGIGAPFSICAVRALKALQNSMMFTPCWPNAGPIGGDGLAAPAGTCSLIYAWTFFAISQFLAGTNAGQGSPSVAVSRGHPNVAPPQLLPKPFPPARNRVPPGSSGPESAPRPATG